MTFKAYLDNVQAKTGKTPADFIRMAAEKGLKKHSEIVAWLKADFGLGHGHAQAITHVILDADAPKVTRDEKIDQQFKGAKSVWLPVYERLYEQVRQFGDDIGTAPTNTYISFVRDGRKFAIVAVTAARLDIGIKRKGVPAEGRYESAGTWNAMVTHRVQITDPAQLDDELVSWLRHAYEDA
ncbi:MAG: DUF4287 domain-containing protein [Chloroflexi bacterium]|nr:DUF4287 domain-containing protein [Chloroflexota bacterium]